MNIDILGFRGEVKCSVQLSDWTHIFPSAKESPEDANRNVHKTSKTNSWRTQDKPVSWSKSSMMRNKKAYSTIDFYL